MPINPTWKGIVLAGGAGTRLHPLTRVISKQLLPVYDKPMVYYPLSVLMLAGIEDIVVITTAEDQDRFVQLLGDGSQLGITLNYVVQDAPNGIADAFIVAERYVAGHPTALVLGDNIFYGSGFTGLLRLATAQNDGGTIFAYRVPDPERFGVVNFDGDRRVLSIEEKPAVPKSPYAVTGLYLYDDTVVERAKSLAPSARGELEITDLNNTYLADGRLKVQLLSRGFAWLDTGTHQSMLEAGQFIATIENRQAIKVGCLEEIAFRNGRISKQDLTRMGEALSKTEYGQYLLRVAAE